MKNTVRVGFLGAGGIAQSHAYALDTLKYYYPDSPSVEKVLVASPTPKSREDFAARFGFSEAVAPDQIWDRTDIDSLFILGPNPTHTPQLLKAVGVPSLKRIYVEKPVGISQEEILALEALEKSNHNKTILVGFQFLQKSPIRKALAQWKSGVFGEPVHFRAEYLHSSYLDSSYRQKHQNRLQPPPINGAVVDLGSHILSMLTAFLGDSLVVKSAAASGSLDDVPKSSDLCTTVLLEEPISGAIGTMTASRVSPGCGDALALEIYGTRGTLIFNTSQPDTYLSYLPEEGWKTHAVMSEYPPASKFPSNYMPSGWLRAMVHNHYLFLGGNPDLSTVPDLTHGIRVQKLLQQIADALLHN